MNQYNKELNNLNEKIRSNKNEINNYETQIKKLKEEEKYLSSQLNQYNVQLNNLNKKIISNKNEINNSETQIKKLKDEENNLNEIIRSNKNEINNSETQIKKLKDEENNLNEIIRNNKNEINNSERQIKILKDEENNLNEKIRNNKNEINNSERKIKILKDEESNSNEKIRNNKNEINNSERQIKILKDEEKELSNQIKQHNEIINELNPKIEDYKNRINNQKEQIRNLDKDKKYLESSLKGNNAIHIDKNNKISETNLIDNLKDFNKKDFVEFYDMIIDIKSVKDIYKGWQINMNERGLKNYEEHKKNEVIKIGVIGNSNKGKSFILSKISKINFPSGTSIRTEGLSVKYPELDGYENRRIALLDSAGLETPVLNKGNTLKGKNEKEIFKEKSREKLITELFLQNYIINISDILIVVVGILTYSEQKLLNRIRTEIQRAKLKKTLYVIHNLITYTSINQVEEYIKDYLLESATFDLGKGHNINTSEIQETGEYYFEKNSDPKIFHLIYANEGSEAGNYYNNFTLKFIESSYLSVTDLKCFDIIESVKERFIEISKEIIERREQLQLTDFYNNDKGNYNFIKLKDEKEKGKGKESEIILKKCLIDELGFSNLKASGFEPTYNLYKHQDNKTIIIRVEAPGNSEIKSKIEVRSENTVIQLIGKKDKDCEPENLKDNIFNTREFGDFIVDIPLKTEDYKILNEKPNIRNISGLFIIEYKLEDNPEESDVVKATEQV